MEISVAVIGFVVTVVLVIALYFKVKKADEEIEKTRVDLESETKTLRLKHATLAAKLALIESACENNAQNVSNYMSKVENLLDDTAFVPTSDYADIKKTIGEIKNEAIIISQFLTKKHGEGWSKLN